MDNEKKRDGGAAGRTGEFRRGLFPRGARGAALLAGVIALALVGGYLLGGGGASPDSDHFSPNDTMHSEAAQVWTCSMHPQVRSDKPGKCPICFMDLIPVTADQAEHAGEERVLGMTPSAVKLANIQTERISRRPVEAAIRFSGDISYDETRLAEITSWVPGRLDRLYVKSAGEKVRKGDKLALIYSPKLISAQEELIQAANSSAKAEAAAKTDPAGAAQSLASSARATLAAAEKRLLLLGVTEEQIGAIKTTGETSDRIVTYAPIGGVVMAMNVREGMYVEAGSKICAIADLSKVWVDFHAYQSDLPFIAAGQDVEFSSGALPGELFRGKVSFIDYILDPKTRTARARAEIDNKNGRLKPGMFVNGTVFAALDAKGKLVDPTGRATSTGKTDLHGNTTLAGKSTRTGMGGVTLPLAIPSTAPLLTGRRAIVYVKLDREGEPVFQGREVVLGPKAGDYYIVMSGLEEGDEVVVNGAFRIDSELEILAKPSMMSQAAGNDMAGMNHAAKETGGTGDKGAATAQENSEKPLKISDAALKALSAIYTTYFDIQMALASDDHAAAVKKFGALSSALGGFNSGLLGGTALSQWTRLSAILVSSSKKGAKTADIAATRGEFYELSKTMIELHDRFGHAGDLTIYLAFCPMARGNTGAYWIQESDTIFNSFYGASMLRCGTIKEKLDPAR